MSWDPARGMHYRTVALADEVFEGEDVHSMMAQVREDEDTLEPQTYEPYVAAFFALLAGVGVLVSGGVARLAKTVVGWALGAA